VHKVTQTTVDINAIRPWDRAKDGFDPYSPDELESLANHIRTKGPSSLQDLTISPDFLLVDGYNRWAAMRMAGLDQVEAQVWAYADEEEMFQHSIMLNLKRRHLDTVTRARKAAELSESYEKQAAQRANAARSEAARGNDNAAKDRENSPAPIGAPPLPRHEHTWERAAKDIGVGHHTVRQVKKVDATGDQELITAMDDKTVSIAKAARLADEPEPIRRAVILAARNTADAEINLSAAMSREGAEYFIAGCVDAMQKLEAGGKRTKWDGLTEDQLATCASALGGVMREAEKWHNTIRKNDNG